MAQKRSIVVTYAIEVHDVDNAQQARARVDAFREAVQPSAEYGLTIFEHADDPPPAADRIVYVLFHETNTGHSDESDGYVEAIYDTEAAANAAMLAAQRQAIADGESVYWNPDTEEEDADGWEHDWRVEHHQVLS